MRMILLLPALFIGCANIQVTKGGTVIPRDGLLAVHGNSLTAGVSGQTVTPYTNVLEQNGWKTQNTGNPGENGAQIRARIVPEVVLKNPDLMILWCCQNSLNIGEDADTIMREYIEPMVHEANSFGIPSMLITPGYWPRIEIDGAPEEKKKQLRRLQDKIVDYAKANDLYAIKILEYDSYDGTHPNPLQYEEIGEKVLEAIEEMAA